MANWYKQLMDIDPTMTVAVYKNGIDGIAVVVPLIEAKDILDYDFDEYCGMCGGPWFTGWTQDLVYFPVIKDDGPEWIDSVPRNPCTVVTEHVGWLVPDHVRGA